jgi:hypothetical protein
LLVAANDGFVIPAAVENAADLDIVGRQHWVGDDDPAFEGHDADTGTEIIPGQRRETSADIRTTPECGARNLVRTAAGSALSAPWSGRQVPAAVASTVAPRLAIVVLPFGNLSNDREQEYSPTGSPMI